MSVLTTIISVDSHANVHESTAEFFLISSSADEPNYAGLGLGKINERGDGNSTLLSTPTDFRDTRGLLVTADNTIKEIESVLDEALINLFVVHVADFKDGRVFSLVRQLRQLREHAEIIIAGEFGLDQASYFYKSGANAFAVRPELVTTLKTTLHDLKTAHAGTTADALPMFR